MAWPQSHDYNEAVQDPALCFEDADLQKAEAVCTALGLPQARSGNFADVYQLRTTGGKTSWAVKCFTKPVRDLQARYREISRHLRKVDLAFMVDFTYLEKGIRIHGEWYPVLKMDWVEGLTLNQFAQTYADKPRMLGVLSGLWLKLAQRLQQAHLAHADLQHGNVLLVSGRKEGKVSLRLIDYDGMHVPALADKKSGELGHPAYQHPQRLREEIYSAEVDRFPHLVIYTALRCLALRGRDCWERYNTGDNLLFTAQDFKAPESSKLLRELWGAPEPELHALAGHVIMALQGPLDRAPQLDELLQGGAVMPLRAAQEQQAAKVLSPAPALPTEEPARPAEHPEARPPRQPEPRDDTPVEVASSVPKTPNRLNLISRVIACSLGGVAVLAMLVTMLRSGGSAPSAARVEQAPKVAEAPTTEEDADPGLPAAEVPAEVALAGKLEAATPMDEAGRHYKIYPLSLAAGQKYRIKIASAFDLALRLEDSSRLILDHVQFERNAIPLTFTAPRDGEYRLLVTSVPGRMMGDYTLTIQPPPTAAVVALADKAPRRLSPPPGSGGVVQVSDTLDGHPGDGNRSPPHNLHLVKLRGGNRYVVEVEASFRPQLRLEPLDSLTGAAGSGLLTSPAPGVFQSRLLYAPNNAELGENEHCVVVSSTDKREPGTYLLRVQRRLDPSAALKAGVLIPQPQPAYWLAQGPVLLKEQLVKEDLININGNPFKVHRIHLKAGQDYRIELQATVPVQETLLDLRGNEYALTPAGQDPPPAASSAGAPDVRGTFRPREPDDYVLLVAAQAPHTLGSYQLKVSAVTPGAAKRADVLELRDFLTRKDLGGGKIKNLSNKYAHAHIVALDAKRTYTIKMAGKFDSYLLLQDDTGQQLAADDDSGGGKDAQVTFTPPRDGRYHIIATSPKGTEAGWYTLTVQPNPVPSALPPDNNPRLRGSFLGQLQGRWKDPAGQWLLEIAGTSFTLVRGGILYSGRFGSNPFGSPATIDFTYTKVAPAGGSPAQLREAERFQGRIAQGIYQVRANGRLALALSMPSLGRPTEFSGQELILIREITDGGD